MGRIFGLLKIFRRDLIIMIIAAMNKNTPAKARALVALAALYVISPIDILPEAMPFAGLVDDMVIIPAAVYGVKSMLPSTVAADAEQKAGVIMKKGGIILFVAALIILFWVSLIFYAFYKLLF